MALDSLHRNAILEVLTAIYDETNEVEEVYDAAELDRKGDIFWNQAARPLWGDILGLHEVDLDALLAGIERRGDAAVAEALRAALEGPGMVVEMAEARRLASAHRPLFAHLDCNRNAQWAELREAVAQPPACAFLLGGARGTGHKFFLDRVRSGASALDAEHCIDVYPPALDRPTKLEHALAGLCDAMAPLAPGAAAEMPAALARLTAGKNLLLLHRLVQTDEDGARWLGEYVGGVVCALVDAVERARTAGTPGGTLALVLPLEWVDGGGHYDRLVRDLRRVAGARCKVIAPDPLQPLRAGDVEDLAYGLLGDADEAARLAERVVSASSGTAEIFANLEEELRRVQLAKAS
jgi:hypothetical protein